MAIKAILRRISSPLLQVGDLAFDCEVSVQRGGEAQFTENRIGIGADISDHSFNLPREFVLEGAVSGVVQLQNFARPGFSFLDSAIDAGLGALEGLTGLNFSSRIEDFEERLEAVRQARQELEVVSKVIGRQRCVLKRWEATTDAGMGEMAQYRLTLKEVQRAGGVGYPTPTTESLALNGSGGSVSPGGGGPSVVKSGTLDVVP